MVFSVFNTASYAQSLKLVLGTYECISNDACEDGYCDIDTHVCKTYASVCPITECPEITEPVCQNGQHNVDGVCIECVSNTDCQQADKPWCDTTSLSCQACSADKPFWTGHYCEACPQGTIQSNGSCVCPPDKPYRVSTCINCESNQIFDSDKNTCRCPDSLPNWNTNTGMCVEACTLDRIWNTMENVCQCPSGKPFWDPDIEQCVACTGISLNGKCYDCDQSVGETVDENKLLCVIDLEPENFYYRNSMPYITHTIARIEQGLKYDYTLVCTSTLIDNLLMVKYGPADGSSEQKTETFMGALIRYTGSPKMTTKSLSVGTIANFYIWNDGVDYSGNEIGFIGTMVLQRPVSRVLTP